MVPVFKKGTAIHCPLDVNIKKITPFFVAVCPAVEIYLTAISVVRYYQHLAKGWLLERSEYQPNIDQSRKNIEAKSSNYKKRQSIV